MQDQPTEGLETEREHDCIERVVLSLLLDPRVAGPSSLEDLVHELGSEQAELLAAMRPGALWRCLRELAFSSGSAARFHELAGGP